MERYRTEETQGTEGPFEFYFQTHGAEPGELKEKLDEICGTGRYALKMVDLDRWILISSTPLSPHQQDRIKQTDSPPDEGSTTLDSPPQQYQPVRVESSSFYFRPVARTATSATQRSVTAVANLWTRLLRKGKREHSRGEDVSVSSPPLPNTTAQVGTV